MDPTPAGGGAVVVAVVVALVLVVIGSEPLVLLWLSSQRYRFLYRQASEALSSLPSPSPPAPAPKGTFGSVGFCVALKALGSSNAEVPPSPSPSPSPQPQPQPKSADPQVGRAGRRWETCRPKPGDRSSESSTGGGGLGVPHVQIAQGDLPKNRGAHCYNRYFCFPELPGSTFVPGRHSEVCSERFRSSNLDSST